MTIIKFLRNHYLLIAIVLFAAILRLYNLSVIPISLNHDETAIGYNAYSILKTGADEYGKFLPLSLKSFGDWKLPFYPLIDIVPILLFGLTEFAVRLPSAIAGIALIPLIYLLANQLFKNKKISLLASFFMAVSPWGIFFSRIAYEANVATLMLVGGLVCFLNFYYEKKNGYWLLPVALLWGLTLFTYHAFMVFMPLFALALFVLLFKKFGRNKFILISGLLFVFFIVLSAFSTLTSGSIGKLSSTSLFDDKHMLNERVNVIRGDKSPEVLLVKKILHNNFSAVFYQIGQNYVSTFSPTFLFDKGGEKLLHNIGNFGNFYLIDALLFILGLILMFYNREKRLAIFVLWFSLGPFPSAITVDAPSSTRLFLMLPVFILIIAYGAYSVLEFAFAKKHLSRFLIGLSLVFLFFVNVVYFLDSYFVHMNYHKAQDFHYGYKEVVELANKYPSYKVVMYDPTNFPYISFLFYNKYDPVKFRKEVSYYPENFGPFYYVKSFGRYSFVDDIDYEHLEQDTLYIDYRGIRNEDYKILTPDGTPIFKYFFKQE
jgi:4-amino-4-deoxy-L-arabinose transferase-like glycosyltransferase